MKILLLILACLILLGGCKDIKEAKDCEEQYQEEKDMTEDSESDATSDFYECLRKVRNG